MDSFEKLGSFYLGRLHDPDADRTGAEPLLYDAKDLTTHAVILGMTGSGKTGLGIALLEEAALDGIPAIAIDPKGDLANLLLGFPELRAEDFRPWVDPGEAARRGVTPEAYAAQVAETWRKGLESWGQDGSRIAALRSAADFAIFTPGARAGLPLTLLPSLAAPPASSHADEDALRERVAATASSLLALLGIEADPLRSREHILLANLVERRWRAGEAAELAALVRDVQSPPFDRVGVLDLESFYPARERSELAQRLNGLLASPSFASWIEGEALDPRRMLYTPEGRPRISILSIAHLSDSERMSFVTTLLHEIVAWMRQQAGTPSLRALLYMDEIAGYFPPIANPPSKPPMLTLLKQARAYGLGVVLATQNPADLDYKGLANTGTWFLGRLQTERDRLRVLDGLEGVAGAGGASLDRKRLEALLAGLKSRIFVMSNAHDDASVVFETRWVMSYLRGPLTRAQIHELMAPRRAAAAPAAPAAPIEPARSTPAPGTPAGGHPRLVLPPDVREVFLAPTRPLPAGATLGYVPHLLGVARLHYASARPPLDVWQDTAVLTPLEEGRVEGPWSQGQELATGAPGTSKEPVSGARFASLPAAAAQPASYARWRKALAEHLYANRPLRLRQCRELGLISKPDESESDLRIRASQLARERRDAEMEKLRQRLSPKLAALDSRIRTAESRVGREQSQYDQQKLQTAVSLGATLLGSLFGRRAVSATGVGRAATTLRSASRAKQERDDVARAAEQLEDLQRQRAELERDLEEQLASVRAADPAAISCETLEVAPRKSDVSVESVALAWVPFAFGDDGARTPLL